MIYVSRFSSFEAGMVTAYPPKPKTGSFHVWRSQDVNRSQKQFQKHFFAFKLTFLLRIFLFFQLDISSRDHINLFGGEGNLDIDFFWIGEEEEGSESCFYQVWLIIKFFYWWRNDIVVWLVLEKVIFSFQRCYLVFREEIAPSACQKCS